MSRLRGWVLVGVLAMSLAVAALRPLRAQAVVGQHAVQPGETLYCIGRGYGVSPWAIAQANGLGVLVRLSVGQQLSIPAGSWPNMPPGPVCAPQFAAGSPSTPPEALTPASTAPVQTSQTYIIQRGDTLWGISRRFGVTVAALQAANGLSGSLIFVGQLLVIPGPVPVVTATLTPESLPPDTQAPPQPTDAPPQPTDAAPLPTQTQAPPEASPTEALPLPSPTATTPPLPSPTASLPAPTATPLPPTATLPPTGDPLSCAVPNIAWSQPGQLLRGGRPEASAFACLAAAGVDVLIDQRVPSEDSLGEPALALQAGLEYINLGIPDDTAPSPGILRGWIDTVAARLAAGQVVLVHDAAGRGRMGFWDAVDAMRRGASAASAIEDRYLARAYVFSGARIGCNDGGRGQVQALAEIAQVLTGAAYYPQVDEYGTTWADCPRPDYMDGWDYGTVLP